MQRNIELLLAICFAIGVCFFIIAFHSFNSNRVVPLPSTSKGFKGWGINNCDIGKDYLNISGWSKPSDVTKLKTELYLQDKDSGGFYKIRTLQYPRGGESKKMKEDGYFDNSGFVAAIRFPLHDHVPGNKLVIISDGPNGEKMRGDYACQ